MSFSTSDQPEQVINGWLYHTAPLGTLNEAYTSAVWQAGFDASQKEIASSYNQARPSDVAPQSPACPFCIESNMKLGE